MLYLSERLNYSEGNRSKELVEKSNKISRMLFGLIQSMK